MNTSRLLVFVLLAIGRVCAAAPAPAFPPLPGDRPLAEYFRRETARVHAGTFAGIKTLDDWMRQRATAREQLLEMLGLSPLPERTALNATVTGRTEQADFHVERLYFQSMPGLYVGANLYVPNHLAGKAPAILYVCGHATAKEGGVAYGAKAVYQHHGAWFAQHGYVCLIIDTIQYGELEGLHHGIYWNRMWWWYARGYTPGGVETWNAIRAIDYLQSRPEVDAEKIGMTGRSGGGAYSWFTAAVDERVKVAVPVSGVTDLQNYVVDGCVRGHCDCMFIVNTYRWDYAKVAALIAPRPLLFQNADKDWIFPLDGVERMHTDLARIYGLYGAADKLGLSIGEGPHKDTPDLQVAAFRWFDRFLKNETRSITVPAEKKFQPAELKAFPVLPADERTTKIHETFVPLAHPAIPADQAEWSRQSAEWLAILRQKSFGGWPQPAVPPSARRVSEEQKGPLTLATWEYTSQEGITLPLYAFSSGDRLAVRQVRLHVLDEKGWSDFVAALGRDWKLPAAPLASVTAAPAAAKKGTAAKPPAEKPAAPAGPPTDFAALLRAVESRGVALTVLPPRGVGPTAWSGDDATKMHIGRRFMLLGQTLEGMRVWDIRQAVEALRQPQLFGPKDVQLTGERNQGVNALYASLFVPGVSGVELIEPAASHRTGPAYLNVLRFLDVPQAAAMAAANRPVSFVRARQDDWSWAVSTARQLGWPASRLSWPVAGGEAAR